MLGVLLILPLLPFLGAALVGALASPLITFTMIKMFGWDEEVIKDKVRKECPNADKFRIDKKAFHNGSTHMDLGIFGGNKQLGSQEVRVKGKVPDYVRPGKMIYL